MKAYKGFNKDLQCLGYQYEVGKDYVHPGEVKLCPSDDEVAEGKGGFHACENPLDVLGYYGPVDSRYCEVELDEVSPEKDDDSKRCGKQIHVGLEIGLSGLLNAGVKFILDRVDWGNNKISNTGNYSAATNTGDRSAATNTGYRSAATNTGYQSAATNTGNYSAATNTGNYSAATNTGYQSAATNTGYQSAATVGGKGAVAIATGFDSKVKGSLGCAIVAVERGKWDGTVYPILAIKSDIVDGDKIKADTFYKVVGGDWAECE